MMFETPAHASLIPEFSVTFQNEAFRGMVLGFRVHAWKEVYSTEFRVESVK
jgi:hypothetical protein